MRTLRYLAPGPLVTVEWFPFILLRRWSKRAATSHWPFPRRQESRAGSRDPATGIRSLLLITPTLVGLTISVDADGLFLELGDALFKVVDILAPGKKTGITNDALLQRGVGFHPLND